MQNTNAHFAEATAGWFDFYARTGSRLAWASADQGIALWLGAMQFAARRADARVSEWRNVFQPWMDLSASFVKEVNDALCADDTPREVGKTSKVACRATARPADTADRGLLAGEPGTGRGGCRARSSSRTGPPSNS